MIYVKFEYKDAYSHGKWRKQSCTAESMREVIDWYGLGKDCEYRILECREDDKESEVIHSAANNNI